MPHAYGKPFAAKRHMARVEPGTNLAWSRELRWSRELKLKNIAEGPWACFQKREQHDLAVRKFRRVVVVHPFVFVDLPKDRGLVPDHSLAPRPQL
jgi:hypothetical protein